MPLQLTTRRRSVAQRLHKTSKQTDFQRLAREKGARQLNVTVMRVLGRKAGQDFPNRTGRVSQVVLWALKNTDKYRIVIIVMGWHPSSTVVAIPFNKK